MDTNPHREKSERRQRSVESAVLAIVIERHPERLPLRDLVDQMQAGCDPLRLAAVEAAVDGLVEVGLLTSTADALCPTPASLRVSELDLGL